MQNPNADLPFDLTLTEDQRMTRENLRRFAREVIRPAARPADEARQPPLDCYDQIAALGLTLMQIPEALGGAGLPRSPLNNVLNLEDLAWGDMSLALGALTPLSVVNVLLETASPEQQERWLPELASDRFAATSLAWHEPRATFAADALQTVATPIGEHYRLDGDKTLVALAQQSRWLWVAARTGQSNILLRVDTHSEGVTLTEERYMGLHALPLYRVSFNAVRVPREDRVGGAQGCLDITRWQDLSQIGLAAAAVGCCQAVLDYVIPYVNERQAFGEPISHRQSVAFMVADMAIELDAMRLLVYRAASRAEQGLSFHKEAYLAHLFAADKAMQIGTNGIQLLGGHGFIREHPLEMWYRNLRAIAVLSGIAVV